MGFNELKEACPTFEIVFELFKGIVPTIVALYAIWRNNRAAAKRNIIDRKRSLQITVLTEIYEILSDTETKLNDIDELLCLYAFEHEHKQELKGKKTFKLTEWTNPIKELMSQSDKYRYKAEVANKVYELGIVYEDLQKKIYDFEVAMVQAIQPELTYHEDGISEKLKTQCNELLFYVNQRRAEVLEMIKNT